MEKLSRHRLVLLGAPLAGKISSLMVLARAKGATLSQIFIGPQGTQDIAGMASWTEKGRVCEVCTIPGGVLRPGAWRELVTPGAELIFVLEAPLQRLNLGLVELVKVLQLGLGPLAAIQITKADLIARGAPGLEIKQLSSALGAEGVPTFISRHDQPETQITAMEYVMSRWTVK